MSSKTILLIILLLGALAFFFIDPSQYLIVPKCPFKILTGWNCPACGIQRAAHAALHGNFATAVQYNWFLILSLPYGVALILAEWVLPERWGKRWMKYLGHRYAVYAYIALFFVWLIVRNLLHI